MGRRVLIVDDDAGVRKMLKTLLVCEHFEVRDAGDGLEALKHLEKELPDLILLDLAMPLMDGQSLLIELEKRRWRASLRVVVLTANMYARPHMASVQVDGWIMKPFHLAELLREIRTVLGD